MDQRDIINNWLGLHVRGESLSHFFSANNIRSCAIYGCGELGDMFYEEARQYDCKAAVAIDRAVTEFHDCKVIPPEGIEDLTAIDLIVICMEYQIDREEQIREYLDDTSIPSVYLSDIVNACWYTRIIMPYCKRKDVKPYFISAPMYRHLSGLTDYELAIGTIKKNAEFYSQNPEYFTQIYTSVNEYDANYIKSVFSLPPVIRRGQTISHTDIRSPYVNVQGGIRYTKGIPDEYNCSVHLLGHCVAFGYGVDDSRTISSQLQRMLNTLPDIYSRFRVVNHGVWGALNDAPLQQVQKLKSLHLCEGDIIVFFYDVMFSRRRFNIKYLKNMCNKYYNAYTTLDDCLNERHNNSVLYIDDDHLSLHGMELAAKHIYNLLLQDGVFSMKQENNKIKVVRGVTEKVETLGKSEALQEYISHLRRLAADKKGSCGSIVMNCNPFTFGHRKLIEMAAASVDFLYVFVVEEDRSVFTFDDRFKLIELGTKDLKNVIVLPSGNFIISALTFPEYFIKDSIKDVVIDTSLDIELFAKYIAPTLNIKIRFVGQEPFDPITRQYNQTMRDILPCYGIQFVEFPRFEVSDIPVSASYIRNLLKDRNWKEIARMVPESTMSFLKEKFDK
jgi:Citrate lyase synthetase